MADDSDTAAAAAGDTPPRDAPPADDGGWRTDRQGRKFTAARGRSGIVYRQGNETVDEALARDAKGPKDRKPRGAQPKPRKPPAPTTTDLKALEYALAEGLRAPAMAGAMIGDEWLAEHFMRQGPVLARNLVVAAEHNPWLREKLEAMVHGEDYFMRLITTASLGGAVIAYAAPPLLYFVRPSFVPDKAREMFGVPDRPKKEEAPNAPPAAPASRPAPPAPPAAAAA